MYQRPISPPFSRVLYRFGGSLYPLFFRQNPSQLLQGSMDKTIKVNLERLPDIPSNHAKGHVISDSFSEVLWSQAREAAGLDVAHRQTSSSLANLGV